MKDEEILKGAEQETTPQSQEVSSPKTSKRVSLKTIFLGDFLVADFIRRQAGLLAIVIIYTVIYISNRYSFQQEMIEIDRLRKQLIDIKYDALTRSSELTERTRQSKIEEYISAKQSDLQTSTEPPYVIK